MARCKRGNKDRPLDRNAVVGIGVLDPLRCHFTGNSEFPVMYQDTVTGAIHELHYTRVHRFVPYPFSDPELAGRGLSSLSRALGYVQQQMVQQQYIGERMNNEPAPGILLVNGMIPADWDNAWELYQKARQNQGVTQFKPIMEVIGKQGSTITIEFIPFSLPPENFDPIQMTELQARAIALGLDTDPQDILPLAGGSWGVNGQAKILDQKNRAGGFTYVLKMLERFFNTKVLPDYLTFKWNYRDSEQTAEQAETAKRNLSIITDFVALINSTGAVSPQRLNDIVVRAVADNVEMFADLLTDESGAIIRLYDDDPTPALDAVLTSDEQGGAPAVAPVAAGAAVQPQTAVMDVTKAWRVKDFDTVAGEFMARFGAISVGYVDGQTARRRAGDLLRQQLRVYGRRAMVEGKKAAGVDEPDLTPGETSWLMAWLGQQSKYVSNYTERLGKRGQTTAELRQSLNAWVGKSLEAAYSAGLRFGGEDGMYEFGGRDGMESCSTCRRLKGQRHKYSVWYKARLRPRVDTDNFECGSWQCEHKLIKVSGASRGRLPTAKSYGRSEFDTRRKYIRPALLNQFDTLKRTVQDAPYYRAIG